ncbi:MAG: DUF308 domain-containing protein [bacterium]|jgi:uncharacterized membrane protein HdeD (DUF308 family)
MDNQIKEAAWGLGVWGAFSVIFGLLIMAWPGITISTFLVVLGVYLLASGAVLAVGSLINHSGHWVFGTLIGALSVIAGLYVFSHPAASALAVLSLIAIWAVVVGMLQVAAGLASKRTNWLLVAAGTIYTLFGFYVFAKPAQGALTLIWLIGLSTVVGGVALIVGAFDANRIAKSGSKR